MPIQQKNKMQKEIIEILKKYSIPGGQCWQPFLMEEDYEKIAEEISGRFDVPAVRQTADEELTKVIDTGNKLYTVQKCDIHDEKSNRFDNDPNSPIWEDMFSGSALECLVNMIKELNSEEIDDVNMWYRIHVLNTESIVPSEEIINA